MSGPTTSHDLEFDPTANAWYVPLEPLYDAPDDRTPTRSTSRGSELHAISLMLHQPSESPPLDGSQVRGSLSENQRRFTRCAIAEESTEGVLRLAGRNFDCRLVDLSIGGFGVLLDRNPQVIQGTIGTFLAPGMNYIVRVTRQVDRADGVYLGLKQIEEVIAPQEIPGRAPPIVSHMIAGFAGALTMVMAYYFLFGK